MKPIKVDPLLLTGVAVTTTAIFSSILWMQHKDYERLLAISKVNWLAAGKVAERARLGHYRTGDEAMMDFELEKIIAESRG